MNPLCGLVTTLTSISGRSLSRVSRIELTSPGLFGRSLTVSTSKGVKNNTQQGPHLNKLHPLTSDVEKKTEIVDPEDAGIHPDWLAMERRVKSRKPKLKSGLFGFLLNSLIYTVPSLWLVHRQI
jgi:hypothetical protein